MSDAWRDWMISVDDHVIEPPKVWQDRVPARHREQAPRIVRDGEGEAWLFEGARYTTPGLIATAGQTKEQFSPLPITFEEMRPGCYDPVERAKDMDIDGVLMSMCFPTFPRFCGQAFYEARDRDLGSVCVTAYNDWMIDEWSASAPGRFLPLIIVPLWDPVAAAREIERCAAMGAKGVAFSENPSKLGLPSIHDRDRYWDPVFGAAAEAGLPICAHIGSSSALPRTAEDSPFIVTIALTPMNAILTCTDWLFSGIFDRFPGLRLCLSEGGIGWIPYVLERCDYTLDRQGGWAGSGDVTMDFAKGKVETVTGPNVHLETAKRMPSEIFAEHIYGCFIDDIEGVERLHKIGVDNVMMETDYPHSDSNFPHSRKLAHERLAGVNDTDLYKLLQGNARKLFAIDPALTPESRPMVSVGT